MWESHDPRPASTDEGDEDSMISDTASSMRSAVDGSERDDLSVREDDYETPISSYADLSQVARSSSKPASLKLVEQESERLRHEVPVATATGRRKSGPLRLRSIKAKTHED